MKAYTVVWTIVCGPIVVAAVGLGLLIVHPAMFTGAALIGAMTGALTALSGADSAARVDHVLRLVLARVLLVGTGAGAIVAMGALLTDLTVPLSVVLGLTSPPAARWIMGRAYGCSPHAMSDHQLCSAWQSTTQDLANTDPEQRLALVQRRQTFLDEMELRNGPGFQDWLDSGGGRDAALACFMVRKSQPNRQHRSPRV